MSSNYKFRDKLDNRRYINAREAKIQWTTRHPSIQGKKRTPRSALQTTPPPPQHPTTLHYEKYLLPHFLSLQHENKIITNESKGYQNYDPKHKPTLKLIT